MVVSTRTPEGDPLRCGVCGRDHLVLLSSPPGDSVCPTCGSHAWLITKRKEEQFPTPEVVARIPSFVDKIRLSVSRTEVENHLVDGLFECLSPYGVMLWLPTTLLSTDPIPLVLIASKGEIHPIDFAGEVTETGEAIIQVSDTNVGKRLLIGVPLMKKHETTVSGILGIAHRADLPLDARDGILRLTRSMAAVTTGCRAFA